MRRFILAACVCVALLAAALYAVYYEGFYVDLAPDAPVTAARTRPKLIGGRRAVYPETV